MSPIFNSSSKSTEYFFLQTRKFNPRKVAFSWEKLVKFKSKRVTYENFFIKMWLVSNMHDGITRVDDIEVVVRENSLGGIQQPKAHLMLHVSGHRVLVLVGNVKHVLAQVQTQDLDVVTLAHVESRTASSTSNVEDFHARLQVQHFDKILGGRKPTSADESASENPLISQDTVPLVLSCVEELWSTVGR